MVGERPGSVGRQIALLFDAGSVAGLTDRQLLEQFNAERNSTAETAFAALVTRHGPMVLDVCHRVIGDLHHAEDAFQAVFLVLARKARSIRDPDLLGNWLFGVAHRTALKARARLARQRKNEEDGPMRRPVFESILIAADQSMTQRADRSVLNREETEALLGEIDRLPGSFRLPVVLCYFEGLTLDEAARRLRWRPGTLRSRLARAREKLRRALTRRGVILPAAALVSALSTRSASARVSAVLCNATTRAAMNFVGGQAVGETISATVVALAREVLRSMILDKIRFVLLASLLVGSVATGMGFLTSALGMKERPRISQAGQQQAAAGAKEETQAAPGRMLIAGRVLDPQGKPVPNASVMAYASVVITGRVIGQTQCDQLGAFRLEALRTSSTRNDRLGAVAVAPGYGAGWVELDPAGVGLSAQITLRPEQVIQGRLFDLQGRPARDVAVSIYAIRRILHRDPIKVRERLEGPLLWWSDPNDFPGWPKPATTDSEGRFTLHGIGRDLRVSLAIHHPQYAQQQLEIETDNTSDSKQVSFALQPAQIITGRITYADTGKPVSHAQIGVDGSGPGTDFQTDALGRFRANPAPGDQFVVRVEPPEGQPYVGVLKRLDWPKGAVEQSIDLALTRGVLIRGKIVETGSDKGVAEARVTFYSQSRQRTNPGISNPRATAAADGSYQIAVQPGPGHLGINVAGDDYVLQAIGEDLLFASGPGGRRFYSNAFIACDPKPGSEPLLVNVPLRRGSTVSGRVIGPDGQPAQDTWIISRRVLRPGGGGGRFWFGDVHGNARQGRFELHGLDPDTEVPVHFFEPKARLGATVHLSGKHASAGLVSVRLKPCGSARARLVDPGGKPLGGFSRPWLISMVVTPGPYDGIKARKEGLLVADETRLPNVDPINYDQLPVADAQGRITFPALIGGASYRIVDRTTVRDPGGPQVRKEFTAKPGEALDLGDILIEKPGA
jgi:RNA polymerase sigma factor (sigma-70 family)